MALLVPVLAAAAAAAVVAMFAPMAARCAFVPCHNEANANIVVSSHAFKST